MYGTMIFTSYGRPFDKVPSADYHLRSAETGGLTSSSVKQLLALQSDSDGALLTGNVELWSCRLGGRSLARDGPDRHENDSRFHGPSSFVTPTLWLQVLMLLFEFEVTFLRLSSKLEARR